MRFGGRPGAKKKRFDVVKHVKEPEPGDREGAQSPGGCSKKKELLDKIAEKEVQERE